MSNAVSVCVLPVAVMPLAAVTSVKLMPVLCNRYLADGASWLSQHV